MTSLEYFLKPNAFERTMNKVVGIMASIGLAPSYMYMLTVKGRRTGKTYSTPVNVLKIDGRYYLVGGRGHTAWSKNAQASGKVTLKRGRTSRQYRVTPVPDDEKPVILKAYLEEYRHTVQRFFAVPAGSPTDAFNAIAERHPVFEVRQAGE